MNYLDLSKRVHLLLRIGEDAPGTRPTTVVGQTGVLGEIVQWVAAAHNDICRRHPHWRFLLAGGEVPLPTGGRILAKSALQVSLPLLRKVNPMVYEDGAYLMIRPDDPVDATEQEVFYIPAQAWHGSFDVAPIPSGQPRYFTITAEGGLEFDTTAERDYTIRLRYRKLVDELVLDADEPMFDEDYHDTIVWWAIVHYYCASRDGTGEFRQKAEANLTREWSKLQNEQLPDFTLF